LDFCALCAASIDLAFERWEKAVRALSNGWQEAEAKRDAAAALAEAAE
jgi:hypothetical protein